MATIYESVLRPLIFRSDPERAHERAIFALKTLAAVSVVRSLMERYNNTLGTKTPVKLFGLEFPNTVGLAAGFDKNAEIWRTAAALGYGHVEVGTVTWHAQPGNDKPRVFRIPSQEAIINRMGFNNAGAEAIAHSLNKNAPKGQRAIPLGVNIGKSKKTDLDQATEDYLNSFAALADYADYFTINVSSPNTPDLRRLQGESFLPQLLGALHNSNTARAKKMGTQPIPMLLKIAPDLSWREIDVILQVLQDNHFNGIIATNTTTARPAVISNTEHGHETGGLSGRPLNQKSVEVVNYIYKATGGKVPIIGSGGVMDVKAAGRLMDAGASLIQVYTGMIYRGPFFAKELAKALAWKQRTWV